MNNIIVNGEIYYLDFKKNKVLDSNFIEADISTRNMIIQQYQKQTNMNKSNDIGYNTSKRQNNHSIKDQIVTKEISEQPPKNIDYYLNVKKESFKIANTFDRIKPNPKDYRINEYEVEKYLKEKKEYDEEYNHVCYEIKEYKDSMRMFFGGLFTCFLLSSIVFLVIYYAIFKESWETIIALLIISEAITLIYYLKRIPQKPSQLEIQYNFSFNKKDQIEKYLYELDKYKEDVKQSQKEYWNNMNGFEFEKAVAELFKKYGATAYVTPKVGDHGIDVVAKYNGTKYAIQCKHHTNQVGPAPLRELRGVLENEFQRGIFVSLNGYSPQAYDENAISSKPLILLTREKLMRINELESLDEFLNI